MRGRKRKWIILLAVGAVILFSGCSRQKEEEIKMQGQADLYERQKEIEQYLRQKYGEVSYEITGIIWRFWNQQYDQMNFQTEIDGRKENFWVRRYEEKDEKFFTDSYFGLCIRPEYENKMREKAEMIFPKAKVVSFLNETEFSQKIEKTDDLKEAKKKGEKIRTVSWLIVTGIGEKELDDKVRQFKNLWEEEEMESLVSVFLVKEVDFLSFDRDDMEKLIKDHLYLAQSVCYIPEEKSNR